MKKRLISLLLVFVMAAAMVPQTAMEAKAASEGICGDHLTWQISENVLTISGTGPMYDFDPGTAPWESYSDQISSLILEEGVTSVGKYAFQSFWIDETVRIPSTLEHVGYMGLRGVINADVHITDLGAWCSIVFESGNAPLSGGYLWLNGERLTEIRVPDGVEKMDNTFSSYERLVNVILPASIKRLDSSIFSNCSRLSGVVFQGDAPYIYGSAFLDDELTAYYPAGNETWTESKRSSYGGEITWIPYEPVEEPAIIQHPQDTLVYTDDYVKFHALALGDGLHYQWQFRSSEASAWQDAAVAHSNTAMIHFRSTKELAGEYRCVITTAAGTVLTTDTARLELKSTSCIEYTYQRRDDCLRYLDEVYLEQYPQLGLRSCYGTYLDNQILQDLADAISQGLDTDREKADATMAWIRRNLDWEADSPYPIDVFLMRKGTSIGQIQLMCDLLRKMGIPAAVGEGWRGDMASMNTEDMFYQNGIVWCYAYIDGQWMIYDVYEAAPVSDPEYMASNYYMKSVDWIMPIYSQELPPLAYSSAVAYLNGKFLCIDQHGDPLDTDGYTMFVGHLQVNFDLYKQYGSWTSVDPKSVPNPTSKSELYRGGWFKEEHFYENPSPSGSRYFYAYQFFRENGVASNNLMLPYNGKHLYFAMNSTQYYVGMDTDQCRTMQSLFALPIGYQGRPLIPVWEDAYSNSNYSVTWSSNNEDIAAVDDNGVIHALQEGSVQIKAVCTRLRDNSRNSYIFYYYVYDDTIPLDYSDQASGHTHHYEAMIRQPTCITRGYTFYTCTEADCADSYVDEDSYVAPTEDHTWAGLSCVHCGAVRKNPFKDVHAGDFYLDPVLWALENNITTGATDTTFNPTGDCLRAQVVTFLWRAAGEPKPTSTHNPFVDVKPSDFYYDAVLWAVENGITNGADATHFNPMGMCNRAQVVTFLYRAFASPAVENTANPFTDVPAGTWYTEPVLWAVESGITNGLSATEFGPNTICNRAQIVTFLYRAYTE